MAVTPTALIPMAHVADVGRSIAFYARLGFAVKNTYTPHGTEPVWAMLDAQGVRLMVVLADGPVDPAQQAVLFYLYFDAIAEARAELGAEGLAVGPLTFPDHSPNGEFRLMDPDGYCLMLAHT